MIYIGLTFRFVLSRTLQRIVDTFSSLNLLTDMDLNKQPSTGPISQSTAFLCQFCQALNLDYTEYTTPTSSDPDDLDNIHKPDHRGRNLHHESYAALLKSAELGCALCCAIRDNQADWTSTPLTSEDRGQIYYYFRRPYGQPLYRSLEFFQHFHDFIGEPRVVESYIGTFTSKGLS